MAPAAAVEVVEEVDDGVARAEAAVDVVEDAAVDVVVDDSDAVVVVVDDVAAADVVVVELAGASAGTCRPATVVGVAAGVVVSGTART